MHQTATTMLPAFFQKFLKTLHTLTVNETKLTSRNAIIFNLFALEKEKESKQDGRTLNYSSTRSPDLPLNR